MRSIPEDQFSVPLLVSALMEQALFTAQASSSAASGVWHENSQDTRGDPQGLQGAPGGIGSPWQGRIPQTGQATNGGNVVHMLDTLAGASAGIFTGIDAGSQSREDLINIEGDTAHCHLNVPPQIQLPWPEGPETLDALGLRLARRGCRTSAAREAKLHPAALEWAHLLLSFLNMLPPSADLNADVERRRHLVHMDPHTLSQQLWQAMCNFDGTQSQYCPALDAVLVACHAVSPAHEEFQESEDVGCFSAFLRKSGPEVGNFPGDISGSSGLGSLSGGTCTAPALPPSSAGAGQATVEDPHSGIFCRSTREGPYNRLIITLPAGGLLSAKVCLPGPSDAPGVTVPQGPDGAPAMASPEVPCELPVVAGPEGPCDRSSLGGLGTPADDCALGAPLERFDCLLTYVAPDGLCTATCSTGEVVTYRCKCPTVPSTSLGPIMVPPAVPSSLSASGQLGRLLAKDSEASHCSTQECDGANGGKGGSDVDGADGIVTVVANGGSDDVHGCSASSGGLAPREGRRPCGYGIGIGISHGTGYGMPQEWRAVLPDGGVMYCSTDKQIRVCRRDGAVTLVSQSTSSDGVGSSHLEGGSGGGNDEVAHSSEDGAFSGTSSAARSVSTANQSIGKEEPKAADLVGDIRAGMNHVRTLTPEPRFGSLEIDRWDNASVSSAIVTDADADASVVIRADGLQIVTYNCGHSLVIDEGSARLWSGPAGEHSWRVELAGAADVIGDKGGSSTAPLPEMHVRVERRTSAVTCCLPDGTWLVMLQQLAAVSRTRDLPPLDAANVVAKLHAALQESTARAATLLLSYKQEVACIQQEYQVQLAAHVAAQEEAARQAAEASAAAAAKKKGAGAKASSAIPAVPQAPAEPPPRPPLPPAPGPKGLEVALLCSLAKGCPAWVFYDLESGHSAPAGRHFITSPGTPGGTGPADSVTPLPRLFVVQRSGAGCEVLPSMAVAKLEAKVDGKSIRKACLPEGSPADAKESWASGPQRMLYIQQHALRPRKLPDLSVACKAVLHSRDPLRAVPALRQASKLDSVQMLGLALPKVCVRKPGPGSPTHVGRFPQPVLSYIEVLQHPSISADEFSHIKKVLLKVESDERAAELATSPQAHIQRDPRTDSEKAAALEVASLVSQLSLGCDAGSRAPPDLHEATCCGGLAKDGNYCTETFTEDAGPLHTGTLDADVERFFNDGHLPNKGRENQLESTRQKVNKQKVPWSIKRGLYDETPQRPKNGATLRFWQTEEGLRTLENNPELGARGYHPATGTSAVPSAASTNVKSSRAPDGLYLARLDSAFANEAPDDCESLKFQPVSTNSGSEPSARSARSRDQARALHSQGGEAFGEWELPEWMQSGSGRGEDASGSVQQRPTLSGGLRTCAYDVYGNPRKSMPTLSASLAKASVAAVPALNTVYLETEGGVTRPVRTASASLAKALGKGVEEVLVSPAHINFGTVVVGASCTRTVRVMNVSHSVIRVFTVPPQLPLKATSIAGPLAAGMEGTLQLELRPLREHMGPHFGKLTLRTEGNIVVVTTGADVVLEPPGVAEA
eukprot:jgi/Botrbrau1/14840/Bobra.0278s0010.1